MMLMENHLDPQSICMQVILWHPNILACPHNTPWCNRDPTHHTRWILHTARVRSLWHSCGWVCLYKVIPLAFHCAPPNKIKNHTTLYLPSWLKKKKTFSWCRHQPIVLWCFLLLGFGFTKVSGLFVQLQIHQSVTTLKLYNMFQIPLVPPKQF